MLSSPYEGRFPLFPRESKGTREGWMWCNAFDGSKTISGDWGTGGLSRNFEEGRDRLTHWEKGVRGICWVAPRRGGFPCCPESVTRRLGVGCVAKLSTNRR